MPSGAGTSSAPASAEVLEMAEPSKTEQRKAEHVNIILQENVSAEYNYWNDVRLVHTALPEIDLDDVDVSVKFFGKRLEAPLIISSMTGGFGMGKEINANLAKAASEVGVAMGVGSQRAALEKPDLEPTYSVVKDYGVPPVFANLGAPRLVWGAVGVPRVAPGGGRSGLDVAKGIALGATMAGMAKPMLEAARVSADAAIQELRAVVEELKAAMFLTGSTSIAALQDRPVIVSPPTASWLEAGEA